MDMFVCVCVKTPVCMTMYVCLASGVLQERGDLDYAEMMGEDEDSMGDPHELEEEEEDEEEEDVMMDEEEDDEDEEDLLPSSSSSTRRRRDRRRRRRPPPASTTTGALGEARGDESTSPNSSAAAGEGEEGRGDQARGEDPHPGVTAAEAEQPGGRSDPDAAVVSEEEEERVEEAAVSGCRERCGRLFTSERGNIQTVKAMVEGRLLDCLS